MGKKYQLPKVGTLYRRVATDCLAASGMDVNAIMEGGDLREIEKHVKIATILEAASHKLCTCLSREVKVPRDFFWTIMFSQEPNKDLADLAAELKTNIFIGSQRADIALKMLLAVHDEWVRLHSKEFFDFDKTNQQCLFMPFQLIGVRDALSYMFYIQDIFDVLGWEIDKALLGTMYLSMQQKYLAKHQLVTDEDLISFIMEAQYDSLSCDIKKALRTNPELVRRMVFS